MVTKLEDKTIDAVNAAVLTNKLIQMASGAVYDENGNPVEVHTAKMDALEDLIEAANGNPSSSITTTGMKRCGLSRSSRTLWNSKHRRNLGLGIGEK